MALFHSRKPECSTDPKLLSKYKILQRTIDKCLTA